MSLLQRKGQRMNPVLWDALIRQLVYRSTPSDDVLVKWVYLLLQLACTPEQRSGLCGLISKCGHPECLDAALLLLDCVTQLEFKLNPAIIIPSLEDGKKRQVEWEIFTRFKYHDFKKVWESVLEPHLDVIAERVASIAINRLQQAYRMLVSVDRAYHAQNPTWRAAIEPHGQDRHPRWFDAIIDLARKALEWMARNSDEQIKRLTDSLISSEYLSCEDLLFITWRNPASRHPTRKWTGCSATTCSMHTAKSTKYIAS